ncbi:response regulator [Bacillus sp. RG28]|uniref:Response regulator n=1 Tax=Gottfriedia endophytica TaxID=2820819 RepID=A0A940NQI1_9BACI|nr:response regulator [Gottfriedia endophytica]MBP0725925.1 response regulator [Gottfriedia endophytica]
MGTILIVDDSLFIRMKIAEIVQRAGYEVVGFGANGQEAIDLFNQLKPDLTLLDITMPIKDGLTALKEIKQKDVNAKVIMISAMAQDMVISQSIENGAIDFIEKPIRDLKILKVLGRVFSTNISN